MADFNLYFPKLIELEGGLSNDPDDKGGLTKFGVVIKEWIAKGYDKNDDGKIDEEDLKLITEEDAAKIAKPYYWDRVRGDDIHSQSVAELLADFAYNSGVATASRKIQKIVGTSIDGVIGPKTVRAINSSFSKDVFSQLKEKRIEYYFAIVNNNPSQKKFLKGWLNRVNSFTYTF